jgi:hypothetical protein
MAMKHGHAAGTYRLDIQHGQTAWISSMDIQHGDMDTEHGHEAWACGKDMLKTMCRIGHAKESCKMNMYDGPAARASSIHTAGKCSMDMQHGNTAW